MIQCGLYGTRLYLSKFAKNASLTGPTNIHSTARFIRNYDALLALMAGNNGADLDSLSLSDTEADATEDLFASPATKERHSYRSTDTPDESLKTQSIPAHDAEEVAIADHDERLRQELQSLRSMNTVISGITSSLEKAKSNMETVSATVNNASSLLNTWTRILSQTEHNQRLILNHNWQGASQDLVDMENEEVYRREEQERRAAEEERKARQREAEREEEERKRTLESTKGTKGRGGRTLGRGTTRAGGYVGVGGEGGIKGTARGSAANRTGSGIGRGLSGSRGRGRGA